MRRAFDAIEAIPEDDDGEVSRPFGVLARLIVHFPPEEAAAVFRRTLANAAAEIPFDAVAEGAGAALG